jgi:hypothetical protein
VRSVLHCGPIDLIAARPDTCCYVSHQDHGAGIASGNEGDSPACRPFSGAEPQVGRPRPADHPPVHHQATSPPAPRPSPPGRECRQRHRWHPAAATTTSLAPCCRSRARAAPLTPPIPPTSAVQPKICANAPVCIFGVGSPLIARVIYPDHGTHPVFMIPVPGVRFFGLRDRDHETHPAERRQGWLQEAVARTPPASTRGRPTRLPLVSPAPHPGRRPSPHPRRPSPHPLSPALATCLSPALATSRPPALATSPPALATSPLRGVA